MPELNLTANRKAALQAVASGQVERTRGGLTYPASWVSTDGESLSQSMRRSLTDLYSAGYLDFGRRGKYPGHRRVVLSADGKRALPDDSKGKP